jgi:GMP synthase (glutamine-hydrolysing)
VRILGEVTKEAADVLRLTDHIFIEELRKSDWYYKTSQAFAVYLPSSPSVSPVTVAVTRR